MVRIFPRAAAVAMLLSLVTASAAFAAPQVKVLDDFEGGVINWTGIYRGSIVSEYAMHGSKAFKVTFEKGVEYPGITASKIDLDWTGYDTLKLDVYNPQTKPVGMEIRIDDDKSGDAYSSRYNGEYLLVNGQTSLEIPFEKIKASDRFIDPGKITHFEIFMSLPGEDTVLYFDNIRLTSGEEGPDTKARVLVTGGITPEVAALREQAIAARTCLAAVIEAARRRGFGTLEANIALVTANLGIDVRPQLPWYKGRESELYEYVIASCDAASDALKETLDGHRTVSPVPPIYDPASLRFEGPDLIEKEQSGPHNPAPVRLFSMLYQEKGPLCEYFTPCDYFFESNAFAGASRYDVEQAPLYKAYHEFADTHRVWNRDEGWCGHIVRDSASMGGGSEPVVVCLESTHTKTAIEEYLKARAPKWKDDPKLLVDIMGGELSYICYCDTTLALFRDYLKEQHKTIDGLNAAWGTNLKFFDEITIMPNASHAGGNRARWYNWQAFNCRRFVDHAAWSKSVLKELIPDMPVSVGAVSYSFRPDFGRSGVDEENIIRQVDDVVLNEAGPSTITTDLLWSLSDGRKPMIDFEYHGDVANVLPCFLHGNTAMAMWWWPDKPDTEFPQFNETALPFSWNIPLSDVAEALKIGLDIRRIGPQIAAFPKAKAEMAILYSRASMLQVPPEFLSGSETPYTMELKSVYSAMLGLDAPVRFISSMQVEEGKLAGYKLLVVPAATYVLDSEAEGILKFAADGGRVVITPNSLMFDQYARPKDYLARLGVSVKSVRSGSFGTSDVKRDAFLQGMIRETVAKDLPAEAVVCNANAPLPEGTRLSGRGVFQSIESTDGATVVAKTADGAKAILEIPYGRGMVYYLATPLAPESMNAFLDAVASRAGVSRPARFTVAGKRDWRIEARAVDVPGGILFYMTNRADKPLTVSAALPAGFSDAVDLRDPWRAVNLAAIEIGPGRTMIFAVKTEKPNDEAH